MLFLACAVFTPGAVSFSISDKKACPCSDPSLCKPVDVPPRPELLGFATESALHWKLYNYTYITTLAVFGNITLDPQVWREGEREGEGYCSLYPLVLDYKRISITPSTFPPSDGVYRPRAWGACPVGCEL